METKLGKNQQKALAFIQRCNGWHSYDRTVRREIRSLAKRGLVINHERTMQFRLAVQS